MSKSCILFFVKYPVAGMVKTRLAGKVGDEFTCGLYRRFVLDILEKLSAVGSDVIVCFDPFESEEKYAKWLGDNYQYLAQKGDGLGDRMKNAFRNAFCQGYSKAILIGSDCPDLPVAYLEQSLDVLAENEAVIGPSADGGYYLIGFDSHSLLPEVFDGMAWSSDKVFDDTMSVFLAKDGYSGYVLEKWYDIDEAGDLEGLLRRNERTGFRKSRSYEYIVEFVNRKS